MKIVTAELKKVFLLKTPFLLVGLKLKRTALKTKKFLVERVKIKKKMGITLKTPKKINFVFHLKFLNINKTQKWKGGRAILNSIKQTTAWIQNLRKKNKNRSL